MGAHNCRVGPVGAALVGDRGERVRREGGESMGTRETAARRDAWPRPLDPRERARERLRERERESADIMFIELARIDKPTGPAGGGVGPLALHLAAPSRVGVGCPHSRDRCQVAGQAEGQPMSRNAGDIGRRHYDVLVRASSTSGERSVATHQAWAVDDAPLPVTLEERVRLWL